MSLLLFHYESKEVGWKTRLRKWFGSLPKWAFLHCFQALPHSASPACPCWSTDWQAHPECCWLSRSGVSGAQDCFSNNVSLTLLVEDLTEHQSLLNISTCVITTRLSAEPQESPGLHVLASRSPRQPFGERKCKITVVQRRKSWLWQVKEYDWPPLSEKAEMEVKPWLSDLELVLNFTSHSV